MAWNVSKLPASWLVSKVVTFSPHVQGTKKNWDSQEDEKLVSKPVKRAVFLLLKDGFLRQKYCFHPKTHQKNW